MADSDADCVELPMAVLVNADTYSAADFRRRAPGAGRGSGNAWGAHQRQGLLPADRFGGAVAISTGAYFTGSGASLISTA